MKDPLKGDRGAADRFVEALATPDDASRALDRIAALLREGGLPPLDRARYLERAARISEKHPESLPPDSEELAGDLVRKIFSALAEAVSSGARVRPQPATRARIRPGQVVEASAPVRIDLFGGWTDTPPVCLEHGGSVVNAAIRIDGRQPVRVTVALEDRPELVLESLDLRRSVRITDARELFNVGDPADWTSLPKAALALSGVFVAPPGPVRDPGGTDLKARLRRFGGGLRISFLAALPVGSGLGTSSILGAALLACLGRVIGEELTDQELFSRTTVLEQVLGTGGGWQDQVGGIVPGVKLARTQPGLDQTISVEPVTLDPGVEQWFRDCCVLAYTGRARRAGEILHGVVRRYLGGDETLLAAIAELKEGAERLRDRLAGGDLDGVPGELDAYWSLKKRIAALSTNDAIESLMARLGSRTGRVLLGAGGGGFLLVAARRPEDAATVRERLRDEATVHGVEIDNTGLTVITEEPG